MIECDADGIGGRGGAQQPQQRQPVADPEKNLGGAEKHATTTCSSVKTPHKREI